MIDSGTRCNHYLCENMADDGIMCPTCRACDDLVIGIRNVITEFLRTHAPHGHPLFDENELLGNRLLGTYVATLIEPIVGRMVAVSGRGASFTGFGWEPRLGWDISDLNIPDTYR